MTNGADVTITGTQTSPAGNQIDLIRRQPGVAAAEPMQHRFAYVGNDLQDLYGIDPAAIGRATRMADAYFADHDASATLARLAKMPDGVLVSQETVNDFQLALGDAINLRLQTGADRQYRIVPFHFVGVVSDSRPPRMTASWLPTRPMWRAKPAAARRNRPGAHQCRPGRCGSQASGRRSVLLRP